MRNRFRIRSQIKAFFVGILLPVALFWGCSLNQPSSQDLSSEKISAPAQVSSQANQADLTAPTKLAKAIIAACPLADPGEASAHKQCADKLAKLEVLRDAMPQEIRWGGQKEANNYTLKENNTTSFDPLVWRQMYLSTFMFSGEPKVEQQKNLTIVHLPIQFRNQLDAGAFPYPFWHSEKKWLSYQQAKELLLIMEDGKVKGALRSTEKDKARRLVERKWDGKWEWVENGKQEPTVVLYKTLFSDANPNVKSLDAAYRAFEKEMRPHSCLACHSPNNGNEMNPLLILNYPNQALTLRHETARQIKEKLMPPPTGIVDDNERQKLVKLAESFASIGDKALAYEGERVVTVPNNSKPSKSES